jgi:hypothetical protein
VSSGYGGGWDGKGGLAVWRGQALINQDFPEFLALQAMVQGGQRGHAAETQEKTQDNAAEENHDDHVDTSLFA